MLALLGISSLPGSLRLSSSGFGCCVWLGALAAFLNSP
jgi:hypothetical protein